MLFQLTLLANNFFKARLIELEKELCLLKNILNENEVEKNNLLVKIGGLRDEIDLKEKELKEMYTINESVISRLSVELKASKNECEKLIQREREVTSLFKVFNLKYFI